MCADTLFFKIYLVKMTKYVYLCIVQLKFPIIKLGELVL
jgi:hypothetical protein